MTTPFTLLMQRCWANCTPDSDQKIGGSQVKPLLQASGLDDQTLSVRPAFSQFPYLGFWDVGGRVRPQVDS